MIIDDWKAYVSTIRRRYVTAESAIEIMNRDKERWKEIVG